MVPQWINDICEKSMKALMELNRPYKFIGRLPLFFLISIIVTCMLMQKTTLSGAQTVLSCTWENATDGNKNLYSLICTINRFIPVYIPTPKSKG